MEMMNMFTVTFDQFNASLQNKIIQTMILTFSKETMVIL